MLPVYPGGHAAYQNFVAANLRKYYPNPDAFSRATWDIIERFWNLDLSYTVIPMTFCVRNTLSLALSPEPLPVCSALICCRLISRSIP